jgi:transposase
MRRAEKGIGDTGYDSNAFVQAAVDRGMKPVINSNLKRFRAIATRYEKTARNYLALTQVACARLWLDEIRDSP